MADEWSYRKLCDAYREEKGTNALGKLSFEFDQSLLNLLSELEKKAVGAPESVRELENARRMALDLLRLRRRKIIQRALMVNEHGDVAGMSGREHSLYDQVRGLCAREDEELQAKVLQAAPPMEKKAESSKKVQILKDIPAYRGADGTNYGPYAPGQMAELPEGEATWMAKGGLAAYTQLGAGGTSSVEVRPNGQKVMYVTKAVKFMKMHIDMDVPAYTNPEGRNYGPFQKGEVVELPEDEARFLIRGSLAIETD